MKVLLAIALAAGIAHADSDDGARSSLALEPADVAWKRPGFRVTLAFPYGETVGLRGAPSATGVGPLVRAGLRLDEDWSVMLSFQYLVARPSTSASLGGMRFAGTIDPTWHISDNVAIAAGFGFGGIVESSRVRPDPAPIPESLETSFTFPNARSPLPSCSGVGVASLVRGEWHYVISSRAAATVGVEFFGQWTGCVAETNRVEPDTGEAIVRRQWWTHVGGTLQIGMTFR